MQHIEFRKQRDFGETLGATFSFIRQNFVNLVKPLLAFSALPVLVGGVIMSGSSFDMMRFRPQPGQVDQIPPSFFQNMGLAFLVGYPLLIIGFLAFYLVVNSYVKLYANKEDLSMGSVFIEMKRKFWSYLGGGILFVMIMMLGMMLCFLPGIYFGVVFAMMFILMSVENVGPGSAMSRSLGLIKNEWWSTFGVYVVVYLIQVMIMSVFSIPMYIYIFLGALHTATPSGGEEITSTLEGMSVGLMIFTAVYYLGILFSSILTTVAVCFRYFSLVEQKEGIGELERINTIGEID